MRCITCSNAVISAQLHMLSGHLSANVLSQSHGRAEVMVRQRCTPYSFHHHHTWPLETSQGLPTWAEGPISEGQKGNEATASLFRVMVMKPPWMWKKSTGLDPCECEIFAIFHFAFQRLKSTRLSINSHPKFGVWGSLAFITILVLDNSWSLQLLDLQYSSNPKVVIIMIG